MISAKLEGKVVPVECKVCTKCGTLTPLVDFWKQKKAKDGLNTWCKPCIVTGLRLATRKRKQEAIQLLGGTCAFCNGTFHQAAYDFHHTDPEEKEGGIAKLMQSYSITHPKFLAELSKCILLCSNCHRTLHSVMYDEGENDACKGGVCGI
jgi:hypothetical protein